jgi:hypothetical protein
MKPSTRALIYMDAATEGCEAEIMKDTASIKTYIFKTSGYSAEVNKRPNLTRKPS